MSDHEFCDHCPGCRPALIDVKTGQPMPADSEVMALVNLFWNTQTSYAERKAFVDVTVNNSRDPQTLRLASEVMRRLQAAMDSCSR